MASLLGQSHSCCQDLPSLRKEHTCGGISAQCQPRSCTKALQYQLDFTRDPHKSWPVPGAGREATIPWLLKVAGVVGTGDSEGLAADVPGPNLIFDLGKLNSLSSSIIYHRTPKAVAQSLDNLPGLSRHFLQVLIRCLMIYESMSQQQKGHWHRTVLASPTKLICTTQCRHGQSCQASCPLPHSSVAPHSEATWQLQEDQSTSRMGCCYRYPEQSGISCQQNTFSFSQAARW